MTQYQLPTKCEATGKSRFSTPGEAKEAMLRIKSYSRNKNQRGKRIQRKGKPGLKRFYHCSHCNGFHFTSMETYPSHVSKSKNLKQKLKHFKGLIKSEEEGLDWKADSLPFPNP